MNLKQEKLNVFNFFEKNMNKVDAYVLDWPVLCENTSVPTSFLKKISVK